MKFPFHHLDISGLIDSCFIRPAKTSKPRLPTKSRQMQDKVDREYIRPITPGCCRTLPTRPFLRSKPPPDHHHHHRLFRGGWRQSRECRPTPCGLWPNALRRWNRFRTSIGGHHRCRPDLLSHTMVDWVGVRDRLRLVIFVAHTTAVSEIKAFSLEKAVKLHTLYRVALT